MKSSIQFFLILTLLTFFSCSINSDEPVNPSGNVDKRTLKFTLKGKVFDASTGASSNMGGGFSYFYCNQSGGYLFMQGYSTLLGKEEGDNTLYNIRITADILNKDLKNQTFTDVKSFGIREIVVYFKKGVQEVWEYDNRSNGELYIENFEFKQGGNIKGTMKIGVVGSSLTNQDPKKNK